MEWRSLRGNQKHIVEMLLRGDKEITGSQKLAALRLGAQAIRGEVVAPLSWHIAHRLYMNGMSCDAHRA